MEPILVTGGTGTLGRHVVRRLREAGRDVRVLTRRGDIHPPPGVKLVTGDLLSGAGIQSAVEGVSTIVHCAGARSHDEIATQHLLNAADRPARPHLVFISVVGAERIPVEGPTDRMMFGYFEMKRRTEQTVVGSGFPYTTLRATQFYDLVFMVMEKLAKLPVIPVPSGMSFQPVEADEVAARLVELALGQPAGLVTDLAGPRAYTTSELARAYLASTHQHRLLVPIRLPGKAARALRDGANLALDHADGKRTWESFLADRALRSKRKAPKRIPLTARS
jgi:uncharacterized protein YbjT (DUF2867 family)